MTTQLIAPDLQPLQNVAGCTAAVLEALEALPEGPLSGRDFHSTS